MIKVTIPNNNIAERKYILDIPIFSKAWWLDSVCGENGWGVVLVEKGQEVFASLPYVKTK